MADILDIVRRLTPEKKKDCLQVESRAVESESEGSSGGVGVGRNFWVESESEGIFGWSRSRKEFLGGVGVGKNVPTPTPTSV
jgi:hypothetical protein